MEPYYLRHGHLRPSRAYRVGCEPEPFAREDFGRPKPGFWDLEPEAEEAYYPSFTDRLPMEPAFGHPNHARGHPRMHPGRRLADYTAAADEFAECDDLSSHRHPHHDQRSAYFPAGRGGACYPFHPSMHSQPTGRHPMKQHHPPPSSSFYDPRHERPNMFASSDRATAAPAPASYLAHPPGGPRLRGALSSAPNPSRRPVLHPAATTQQPQPRSGRYTSEALAAAAEDDSAESQQVYYDPDTGRMFRLVRQPPAAGAQRATTANATRSAAGTSQPARRLAAVEHAEDVEQDEADENDVLSRRSLLSLLRDAAAERELLAERRRTAAAAAAAAAAQRPQALLPARASTAAAVDDEEDEDASEEEQQHASHTSLRDLWRKQQLETLRQRQAALLERQAAAERARDEADERRLAWLLQHYPELLQLERQAQQLEQQRTQQRPKAAKAVTAALPAAASQDPTTPTLPSTTARVPQITQPQPQSKSKAATASTKAYASTGAAATPATSIPVTMNRSAAQPAATTASSSKAHFPVKPAAAAPVEGSKNPQAKSHMQQQVPKQPSALAKELTESTAALIIQRLWRGWRLSRHRAALRELVVAAKRAAELRGQLSGQMTEAAAEGRGLSAKQAIAMGEAAMKAVLQLDSLPPLPMELKAIKRRFVAELLQLQDLAQASASTPPAPSSPSPCFSASSTPTLSVAVPSSTAPTSAKTNAASTAASDNKAKADECGGEAGMSPPSTPTLTRASLSQSLPEELVAAAAAAADPAAVAAEEAGAETDATAAGSEAVAQEVDVETDAPAIPVPAAVEEEAAADTMATEADVVPAAADAGSAAVVEGEQFQQQLVSGASSNGGDGWSLVGSAEDLMVSEEQERHDVVADNGKESLQPLAAVEQSVADEQPTAVEELAAADLNVGQQAEGEGESKLSSDMPMSEVMETEAKVTAADLVGAEGTSRDNATATEVTASDDAAAPDDAAALSEAAATDSAAALTASVEFAVAPTEAEAEPEGEEVDSAPLTKREVQLMGRLERLEVMLAALLQEKQQQQLPVV